jgi:hypothetical protein
VYLFLVSGSSPRVKVASHISFSKGNSVTRHLPLEYIIIGISLLAVVEYSYRMNEEFFTIKSKPGPTERGPKRAELYNIG